MQTSLAVTAGTAGKALPQLNTNVGAGQLLITGGTRSMYVNVAMVIAPELLHLSLGVNSTVIVPVAPQLETKFEGS